MEFITAATESIAAGLREGRDSLSRFYQETVRGERPESGGDPATVTVSQKVLDGKADIHDVGKALYGIHNMLKYEVYDEETGLFYNQDSVGFCFEVVPQTGADDEMCARLSQLFTPIPPGYGVQWLLTGTPMLSNLFDEYIDVRHIAKAKGSTSDFFVELAKRRVRHVTKERGRPLFETGPYSVKDFRLVFSLTRSGHGKNPKTVKEVLELRENMMAQLRTAHLPASSLDPAGLITAIKPLLDPELMFGEEISGDVIYDEGRPIRDQVTRFGSYAHVDEDEILFGTGPANGEEDRRISMRSFGVQMYPSRKHLHEMANIIGSFFDDGLQYPCPFAVCGGMYTLDPQEVNTTAQLKGARSQQNSSSKMAQYQPALGLEAQDWKAVLYQLNSGGSMTKLYHTLLLFAPRTEMHRASQIALNIWRSERFTIVPLRTLHLPMLYASLPMTLTKDVFEDLSRFRVMTTKTTVNAVDMSPVIGEWKGAGRPILMFFGRRGTPTFVDLYANSQGNYNLFVSGTSGSGKSVTMNEVIASYRGAGARVWVIDVGRSYRNMIALQKGTFLEFTQSTPICINPFSWVGMDTELEFKEELRMLKPMIARMASPSAPISDFQYALISKAIQDVWKDYGQDTNPTLISDYLCNNIKDEKGNIERVAYELGMQMEPFTDRGIHGRFFNGKATINLDGDMIGLELEELKNAKDLQRVVLFVLTSRISHDMYLSRDREKLCLVDEAWQLLGGDQETADFIEEGYRRARKYRGIFAVGTQSIADAFMNKASEAAYNNADWKFYLRQDRKTLDKLLMDGVVNFSPAVKSMLLSLCTVAGRYSEVLISSPSSDAIVRHIPDPYTLLMASTKAEDTIAMDRLLDKGVSANEAILHILKQRGVHG